MLLQGRRCERGTSDPVKVECDCIPSQGRVLLFYRYSDIPKPETFAANLSKLCMELDLFGKLRVSHEGINISVGGTMENIHSFRSQIVSLLHILGDVDPCDDTFFKPSPGCKHCFSNLSVKVVQEICPFGSSPVSMRMKNNTVQIHALSPAEFHQELVVQDNSNQLILDVRNYYESRIGHFESAIQPAIRRFSSLPQWVDENNDRLSDKRIFTYCTGGIRCEKAASYIKDNASNSEVFMLEGGIHNYLEWIKTQNGETVSLFKGSNYVFDARVVCGKGSDPVSMCSQCHDTSTDRYLKCFGVSCHLMVVCCVKCSQEREEQVFCCMECRGRQAGEKLICQCERERRKKLLDFDPSNSGEKSV